MECKHLNTIELPPLTAWEEQDFVISGREGGSSGMTDREGMFCSATGLATLACFGGKRCMSLLWCWLGQVVKSFMCCWTASFLVLWLGRANCWGAIFCPYVLSYIYVCVYVYIFFSFLAAPTAYGNSQVRDQIWAGAVTFATAAAMPDPRPTALGWGWNKPDHQPTAPQWQTPYWHL